MLRKKVCIVVPCYNPSSGWEERLEERYMALTLACAELPIDFHLSLTNDGSTKGADGNAMKARFPKATVVSYENNQGKGHALRKGVQANEADFYILTDVDFPYTTESMRRVVLHLLEKGGIAAGNRDATYYASVPFFRKIISKSLRWMLKVLLRMPVTDSQCGLKGFDAKGKEVFLKTQIERFLFDLEFLMFANGKVPVEPVPVELRPDITFSTMGWRILWREGRNFMRLFWENR